jgi:ribonuclease P protein component
VSQSNTHKLNNTFPKSERLHSKKLIQELFQKGSFFYSYPFKVLFLPQPEGVSHQVLISVSKRKFKNATDRNLIKRRIREAYRLNKHTLNSNQEGQHSLSIAYIYTGKEIPTYQFIEAKLSKSLRRLMVEVENANRD